MSFASADKSDAPLGQMVGEVAEYKERESVNTPRRPVRFLAPRSPGDALLEPVSFGETRCVDDDASLAAARGRVSGDCRKTKSGRRWPATPARIIRTLRRSPG